MRTSFESELKKGVSLHLELIFLRFRSEIYFGSSFYLQGFSDLNKKGYLFIYKIVCLLIVAYSVHPK